MSQRLSVVSRIGCPGPRSCFLTTSSRLPDSDRQKRVFIDSFTVDKNKCSIFSRLPVTSRHGPSSPTCVQVSQQCLETRPNESKHACIFLGSLTRLARQSAGKSKFPQLSTFVCSTNQGVQHVCTSFSHEKLWICARPTTDHDLVSVIPDKKKKRKRKRKGDKCKSATVVFFADLNP